MHRIQPQPIDVIIAPPHQRVIAEEPPHLVRPFRLTPLFQFFEHAHAPVEGIQVAARRGELTAAARTRVAQALADALSHAGVPIKVQDSEADVMWSKLVRLNALACTTSAYNKLLGEIRSTPALRADLVGAIEEACAVGKAEGAYDVDPASAIGELERAHDTLGSSMQRDIAAGREPELDAIPGAVLRAGARHGISCPTIERLYAIIAARVEVVVPGASGAGAISSL